MKSTTIGHGSLKPRPKALFGRLNGAGSRSIKLTPPSNGLARDSMTIRLASTDGQRSAASMLLSRMYSWRGYGKHHSVDGSPNSVIFTAVCKDDVVGTLTLTVDSPAGLAVDKTFPEELAPFRSAPGAKLCELTKFAFDWVGPSQRHLAALFHLVFIYGSRRFACTDLFIEVNPRHCRYYEAMLGFVRVGEVKTNESVNAPSQMMWLNVGAIRRMIDQLTAASPIEQRSLYHYFFSPDEEDGLYGRLTGNQPRMGKSRVERLNAVNSGKRLLSIMVGARLK
jgi:hypothetical protein